MAAPFLTPAEMNSFVAWHPNISRAMVGPHGLVVKDRGRWILVFLKSDDTLGYLNIHPGALLPSLADMQEGEMRPMVPERLESVDVGLLDVIKNAQLVYDPALGGQVISDAVGSVAGAVGSVAAG